MTDISICPTQALLFMLVHYLSYAVKTTGNRSTAITSSHLLSVRKHDYIEIGIYGASVLVIYSVFFRKLFQVTDFKVIEFCPSSIILKMVKKKQREADD